MAVNTFRSDIKILHYPGKLDYFFNAYKTLIVTELDLTNKCNHRCPGCCGNNENNAELTLPQIEQIARDLKECDNKGVILSGGGEPTISPYFYEAVHLLKEAGQNLGINSHGMNLDEDKCRLIASNMEYFRISLDAGSKEMYAKIHGMNENHFAKTLKNIELFANTKAKLGSKTSFGVGFLTSERTIEDAEKFVLLVKERGADFAQFRPFTGDTTDIIPIMNELRAKYETKDFKIVASMQKYLEMEKMEREAFAKSYRGYSRCHGMYFSTCISADFKVWACLHYRQDEGKLIGDLSKQSLKEVLQSTRMREVYETLDCSKCPILCRNDAFNKTLDELSLSVTNSEFL